MRRCSLIIVGFWGVVACWALPGQSVTPVAPQQLSYYVRNGDALQTVQGNPAGAAYTGWQVWLYPQKVRVSPSGLGLVYTRWGVLQAASARAVMEQLAAYQQFEGAYGSFFGADSWGRLTFSYPIGPVAVQDQEQGDDPFSLHAKIDLLDQRVRVLVEGLRPSLTNGDRSQATAPVQNCLKQVRSSMQDIARFHDRLSRLPGQQNYLSQELALITPGVTRAESESQSVTAAMPTVRLPASNDWMSHSERAGRDGTIEVKVTEMGSSVWIQQHWEGGDGSMSGTRIITIVPYQDIGKLDVEGPRIGNGQRWTLLIQPINANGFPQSVTSPERTTATRTYRAVNLKTSEEFVYLEFSSPTDAQEAYAFFLYHKERRM
jgi:hypothetical protein